MLRARHAHLRVKDVADADDVWVRDVTQDAQLAQDALGLCGLDEAVVNLLDRDLLAIARRILGRPYLSRKRKRSRRAALLTGAAAQVIQQLVAILEVAADTAEEFALNVAEVRTHRDA
eukprot:1542619-Prymnesium_polylepis.1